MLPPHWLCKYCGMIINDSGSEPSSCTYCGHEGFQYLGFEGEYDGIEARAQIGVIFDPEKFTPEMKDRYWRYMSAEERVEHQRKIDDLAEQVRQRMEENGYLGDLFG
jgi:predicted  nucleic acid-binding Zn-ribbon protein